MTYAIEIDYFATGEGRHVWQTLIMVEDEQDAVCDRLEILLNELKQVK